MSPQPDTDGYMAHAHPVFGDFVAVADDGRSVRIYGLDLGHGYRRAVDVMVVRFLNDTTMVHGRLQCDRCCPAPCRVRVCIAGRSGRRPRPIVVSLSATSTPAKVDQRTRLHASPRVSRRHVLLL